MNSRRTGRFYALVLALLVLVSVVPGFMPGGIGTVAAAGYIINVTAETNYGDSVLFAGFPYFINGTINATQQTFANITLYYVYPNGTEITVYSRVKPISTGLNTFLINSTDPIDVDPQYSSVPRDVSQVKLVVYEYDIANGNIPGTETIFNFNVKFPFEVTYSITSSVPYDAIGNGTWVYDRAFKEISFDLAVTIQYNDTLVGSGIELPNNVTVNVTLPDGTSAETVVPINSTGGGDYTFVDLMSTLAGNASLTVLDTTNQMTQILKIPIYDWGINFSLVNIEPHAYSMVPFNITGTVYDFTHLGTNNTYSLGLNTTVNVSVGNYSTVVTLLNGKATFDLTNVVLPAGSYNLSAAHIEYTPSTIYGPIEVEPWNILVIPTITCTNGLACTEFYAGINQTLNISVTYLLSPHYNLTTTANYRVLLNGVEMYNGTINVINNSGWTIIPVSFPENGTVTVEVWDSVYHPEPSTETRSVVNWDIAGAYQVIQYPDEYDILDTQFYVGVPANLTLGIFYNEPCPVNTTVNITLELPNGTALDYSTVVSDANGTSFDVPQTFLFTEPGFVTVIYHDSLGKSYSFTIPVKDWGIFVDASPEELTQNESVNFNVFVAESLYFDYPDVRDVIVTLELPGSAPIEKTLTLEINDDISEGQGGYQGVITFENVTPQMPGIGWVIVTDVLSGKTVKMPIKINAAITPGNRWIDVTAVPATEPVYAYLGNSLKIDIQYMYSDGIAAYKDTDDHVVNITITDADGTAYHLQLPVDNGFVEIPNYAIPVNGTNNIAIDVVDAYNASITGGAVVPVTPWDVTFDFATDGTVWQYVHNTLYVTVHVNGPDVPVNVTLNGELYTDVTNGWVIEYPITDPQGTLTYNVIATYNGHQVGSSNYTVEAQPWDVTFDFATDGPLWMYLPNRIHVTTHINGPDVPVVVDYVSVHGPSQWYDVRNGDTKYIPITSNDYSILPYNSTFVAYYNGHPVGHGWYYAEPVSWNATISITPEFVYYGISTNITATVTPTNGVPLNASDLTVKLIVNGHSNVSNGVATVYLTNPTDVSGVVQVYYNGHLINSTTLNIPVREWSTNVTYTPKIFYYLPSGYANEPLAGSVVTGLPADVARAANITFEVSLPSLWIGEGTSGGNEFQFNFSWAAENFVFNSSGIVPLVIKLYDPATNFIYFNKTYNISIVPALEANVVSPSVAYVNVSFTLNVSVTSNSPNPKITVTINGTNHTNSTTQNGTVLIHKVNLTKPGEYTVIIHDASINATITRTLEVRDWHIEVTATPDNITAGSVYGVNFTVKLVDSEGDIADITENVNLSLEFSNTSVIPNGFYTWTVPVEHGEGILSAHVFAPVAGLFRVVAVDGYGNKNDTSTITVSEPNPEDLTYVYVNIRKPGSLESPDVPVNLYWGLKVGDRITYFRMADSLVQYDDSREAVFKLYPTHEFRIYVIAFPKSFNRSIVYDGMEWNESLNNTNQTYYSVNTTVEMLNLSTVNGVTTATLKVNVTKYKITELNITKVIYTVNITAPGAIDLYPGSSSVQGNAILANVTTQVYHIGNGTTRNKTDANNTTISVVIRPNDLSIEPLDNTSLKPTQAGEYFTFRAILETTNATEQFNATWSEELKAWLENLDFISDTVKEAAFQNATRLAFELVNPSSFNGPVPNATVYFHINNTAIAYLEPTNGTTDANGTVSFKVYTKAQANMTPEQLRNFVGSVNVWATYENLTTDNITVNFGGIGSISGDITDDTGMQVPGATVTLKVRKGGVWVNATDFEGNILATVSSEDGHYAIGNVPAAPEGTTYMVVVTKGNLTGYAYVTVKPFATSTADVKLTGNATETGFAMYPERVANADTVYFVFNNLGTPDAFSTTQYIARTVPIDVRTKAVLADQFNLSTLTANDVLISVGGSLVNPVTAAYEDIAPVHMVINGSNITIVAPGENFTWQAPKVWWNVSQGYFIIQLFEDESGALVVTIYGTDADSTAAGAYYFMAEIYPDIDSYNGIHYFVGLWKDTEAGADVPLPGADLGDTSGFSAGDSITIVAQG
ncbi:hypothetical protein CL1_0854 [Thermococcus cleftensis]|uniref:Uncharacterized protein n=1 Tax=Thermococcus cleftensis (strain DSM 27260 / KACC 17922 / CL1) TaxID=163003 RepID=I3ZTM5_THECF|nr:carboxypeptidase-like regulatory domain-containing protein [Thermococcus cleftensis]AFL95059.1 hypothetical protein CL1_0854 [Thermococcus cleftensis]